MSPIMKQNKHGDIVVILSEKGKLGTKHLKDKLKENKTNNSENKKVSRSSSKSVKSLMSSSQKGAVVAAF